MIRMRIAITGFVSADAGSVASANALLLRGLLERGCEVVFFSKSAFSDPRPAAGNHPNFQFVEVDNRFEDRLRRRLERLPILGKLAGMVDAASYNRLLVREISRVHAAKRFDLCLWLGDYARGRTPGLPVVSFVQGPPGTDARSLISHFPEIAMLAGSAAAWKWRLLAGFRLSRFGLPPFHPSDRFIVGSRQSLETLQRLYKIPEAKISTLPYPIDLHCFQPSLPAPAKTTFDCLWLGRIIPRKRLDLFLDGASVAIRRGLDLRLTIVGDLGFIPGYDQLIRAFPFPERLTWLRSLPREQVSALLHRHDVLMQPSDEENFGSSVAEAQACGLPVIIGQTNGNADYLCSRDIVLADDRPETVADALQQVARSAQCTRITDQALSRECAERYFRLEKTTDELLRILESVAENAGGKR